MLVKTVDKNSLYATCFSNVHFLTLVAAKHGCMASYKEMLPILLRFSATLYIFAFAIVGLIVVSSVVTDSDLIYYHCQGFQ